MNKVTSLFIRHKTFLTILGIAVIVRLFFMSFAPFKTDMDSFIAWGEHVREVGFANFYSSGIWTDYAPGYFYFLWVVASIKGILFADASRELYEALQKSMPLLLDLMTGLLIYLGLRRVTPSKEHSLSISVFIASLYLFSPFTFFNGAIWGQVDSVFTFFLALSFFYLIKKKLPVACGLYVVACVIKPQAVIVAPAYLLFLLNNYSQRVFITSALISIGTFYALCFPFFGVDSLGKLYGILQASIDTYKYGSINTFNLWGTYGFWKPDTETFMFGLTQQMVGTYLFILAAATGFFAFWRAMYKQTYEHKLFYFLLLCSYLVLAGVMLLTRMHERYLYPFFFYVITAFGMFLVLQRKAKTSDWLELVLKPSHIFFIFLYCVLVFIHLINLYYVYVYYQYFGVGVPLENTLFYGIESSLPMWSYLQLGLACVYVCSLPLFIKQIRGVRHE